MRAPFEATFANSVLTGPGQSAQTFIPLSLSSAASAIVKLRTYDFVAAYTAKFPSGRNEARLAVFIMTEFFFIRGMQLPHIPVREMQFKSIISSSLEMFVSSNVP